MRSPGQLAALVGLIATGAFVPAATATAATWTVNTTADAAAVAGDCQGAPGDCSLRQAVAKASSGDTISLPASGTAYGLTFGPIALDKALMISGAGARTTTVDGSGNGGSGMFTDAGLPASATVTASGITISGASSSTSGGAFDLATSGVTIDLTGVALAHDTATGAGGAIELTAGTLDITESTLGPGDSAGTGGGAIDNDGGTLTLTDSTVSGDTATTDGGGISTEGGGTTALRYVTVALNSAGSAGGDLYSNNPSNTPPGFTVANTIVADGGAPNGGDCNLNAGGFVDSGYNVTDAIASTQTATCGFTSGSNDVLGDARLGSLADNGGQTDTIALAAGSPAINLIPVINSSCTGTDQRGTTRPQGSGCDAGALEAGGGETAPQWNPAHDFQTSPEENPSPDSLGNSAVWSYEQVPLAELGTPADYTLLPSSGTGSTCSGPSLYYWGNPGPSLPVVDYNGGSTTYVCSGSVTVPAHTLVMHPSASDYSIVAWTSPVSGHIAVAGSFVSMDPNGGSGTTWEVADGSTSLASGTNAVGGAGNFEMPSLSVAAGDTLYFILGPEGSATFETTELNLTITDGGLSTADVGVSASAPSSVGTGQPVADTFTVTDHGPAAAAGVTLSDILPQGVTLQSVNPSQGSCAGTTSISCALGALANGAQATVTVTLVPGGPGLLSNTASVTASTTDPNPANNSATAMTSVGCVTSMTVDQVQVLADCITPQGGGTFVASGHTRFGDGASIVDAGTQTPATLVLNPGAHSISIAPASGGGAQSGELEAGGADVATGDLVIATQGVTDPVSGLSGTAVVNSESSVDLSLSGWTFGDLGVSPTVYLAPSGAGGGAIVDGQLTLPTWLGSVLAFGPLGVNFPSSISGQLAVQASSSGQVYVLNGGVSFQASVLGDPGLKVAQAQLQYQRAGDQWSGSAVLGMASMIGLTVSPVIISDGKLVTVQANFSCATSKICGTSGVPTIGAILDVKDVSLNMINLQGISYTRFIPLFGPGCFPRFKPCPTPPPAPQINGNVIVGLLGDRVIAGGGFTYLLNGAFSASGTVGLAPLYGGSFPNPAALGKNQTAQSVVNSILSTAHTGVELAGASIAYTPPSLLQASGTVYLPPPPFPFQFLQGKISIGIDPPHFTGEGSLNLVIPSYVPVVGGETFGGVQALISDAAAAAEASTPQVCIKYIGCTPSLSVLVAFDYATAHVTVDINGGNINNYATVPEADAGRAAASNSRVVQVPSGKQLASFTIRSARGTPNVQLIGPARAGHRRRLTLATSRRLRNRSGALAWPEKRAHTERFLVFLPTGGSWTVKRLRGPRIVSVSVTVPRQRLRKTVYPRPVGRASDLPAGKVSTGKRLTLHYSVPSAAAGTTVELWAGTAPHGAGGVMIARGLPPSGVATWKPSGLPSGRYWPYAIVSEHGIPVSIEYWPRSVELVDPAAPDTPPGVQAVLTQGGAYVAWNGVRRAQTYAIMATPVSGGAPVRDAVPASQLADLLKLAHGRWSITVQALGAAGHASLPSPPSILSVG